MHLSAPVVLSGERRVLYFEKTLTKGGQYTIDIHIAPTIKSEFRDTPSILPLPRNTRP